MSQKIKLMSFGQDLIDESSLFIELSVTHREQGSVSAAYSWAQAALKVSYGNWVFGVKDTEAMKISKQRAEWQIWDFSRDILQFVLFLQVTHVLLLMSDIVVLFREE